MARFIAFILVLASKGGFSLDDNFNAKNMSTNSTSQVEEQYEINVRPTSVDTVTQDEWEVECYATKHPSFCNCSAHVLLYPTDYTNESGVLHVRGINKTHKFDVSLYDIYDARAGEVLVCLSYEMNDEHIYEAPKFIIYMNLIGLGVSIAGMLIHLVMFLFVRELRNMPGCNLACHCLCLTCGYVSFLVGNVEAIKENLASCVATAAITQLFMLASFLWMNVIAFDIFRSLWSSAKKLIFVSAEFNCRKFLRSSLFCWGTSFVIVAVTLTADIVDGIPKSFRPTFGRPECWFNEVHANWIYFIVPFFMAIGLNIIFFGLSAYVIFSNQMKTDDPDQARGTRKNFIVYFKLGLITGMLWISGLVATATNNEVLWSFFAILATLHGFFIFLAFTFRRILRVPLIEKMINPFRKDSLLTVSSTLKESSSNACDSESKF